ncbi:MAG TPA: hypothetical protein VJL07_02640 [Dehalococcoidia bacterium]|nr:hypothetical protein [Dehalococcoidia bacterium]
MTISENAKIYRAIKSEAAGQTLKKGAGIQMVDVSKAIAVLSMGAMTAGAEAVFAVQHSDDDVDANYVTLASLPIPDSAADEISYIEVTNISKAWLRCTVARSVQDSVIDGVILIAYGGTNKPVPQTDASLSEKLLA